MLKIQLPDHSGHYSYAEVGCYSDNPEDRDLPYAAIVGPEGGLTHELCVTHCYTSVSGRYHFFQYLTSIV